MASHDSQLSINPGLEAHFAAIGKAVVEAAVASGEGPNDKGEFDVDITLQLKVSESNEGLLRHKQGGACCCCILRPGLPPVCHGECCS